jgi:hypothetical protein
VTGVNSAMLPALSYKMIRSSAMSTAQDRVVDRPTDTQAVRTAAVANHLESDAESLFCADDYWAVRRALELAHQAGEMRDHLSYYGYCASTGRPLRRRP